MTMKNIEIEKMVKEFMAIVTTRFEKIEVALKIDLPEEEKTPVVKGLVKLEAVKNATEAYEKERVAAEEKLGEENKKINDLISADSTDKSSERVKEIKLKNLRRSVKMIESHLRTIDAAEENMPVE